MKQEDPLYLGIFCDAAFLTSAGLAAPVAECRKEFDSLNISVLTSLLTAAPLREGLSVETIVEDFRMCIDFFHLRLKTEWDNGISPEQALKEHEKRCHRLVDILLHGVFIEKEET